MVSSSFSSSTIPRTTTSRRRCVGRSDIDPRYELEGTSKVRKRGKISREKRVEERKRKRRTSRAPESKSHHMTSLEKAESTGDVSTADGVRERREEEGETHKPEFILRNPSSPSFSLSFHSQSRTARSCSPFQPPPGRPGGSSSSGGASLREKEAGEEGEAMISTNASRNESNSKARCDPSTYTS